MTVEYEYGEQQPAEDPAGPGTGHPAVDEVMRTLAVNAGAAPAEQVPAYQAAHRTLREILASIDEE